MPGKAKVKIEGFRMGVIRGDSHTFTAKVELTPNADEAYSFYSFTIDRPLSKEEQKELDALLQKIVARVKSEFKESLGWKPAPPTA